MNENRISIDLAAAKITAINQAISTLEQEFDFLIALSAADKRSVSKLGAHSLPYAQRTVEYASTNPEFLPAYVDVGELKKDLDIYTVLSGFYRRLFQIVENLDDTAVLGGSEAAAAISAYYKTVQHAAKMGIPGAKAIYDDLSQRFEAQKARPAKPEPLT